MQSWLVRRFPVVAALALGVLLCGTARGQRNLKDIPSTDPEVERRTFVVADGFEVNLWAADPMMAKPIQMNFDARGRLWIASSEVYPQIKPGQPATDKILVLEDTNHDGQADKTTVFADGLLIPTGIAPGDGGAYVANSTDLVHLRDTDGDGKADESRIVLSGFGTEDTHHLLHTLRWGHDGCLYMNQSIYIHSHVETPYGVKRLNGGGIWRFRPENQQLDVLCYGFVNPWGHHFDRWGRNFATDGAYGEGINYVFPGAVYVTAPGAKRLVSGLNPGSPKHCGLEIASGRHLPPEWQGAMLTNDFRAHRVCRFTVTEDNSGFASRQEVEVIKSNHVAFRPIDVKMGPDGAIYIADWYNPIIQHGEVDFRDPRRDHVNGRIWRVTAKGRPTLRLPDLVNAPTPALLDQLKAPEEWVRLHAKLTLKSRGASVLPDLAAWLAALDPKDSERDNHRLEALWVHQNLDNVNESLLRDLLASADHRVRSAALRVATLWLPRLSTPMAYLRAGVSDEHAAVRIEAVRGLTQMPSAESALVAAQALDKPLNRFLDFALWRTFRDLETAWLPEVRAGKFSFGGRADHLAFALQAVEAPGVVQPLLDLFRRNQVAPEQSERVLGLIASLGGPKELAAALDLALDSRSTLAPSIKASLLTTLAETATSRRVTPEGDLGRIAPLLASEDEAVRVAAARVAGAWKLASIRPQLIAWARAADKPTDPNVGAPEGAVTEGAWRAALEALALLGGAENTAALAELAKPPFSFDRRHAAVVALARLDARLAAERAAELLAGWPPNADPLGLIASLTGQRGGADALAVALAGRKLTADAAKLTLRAVQSSPSPSESLASAVRDAGGLQAAGWKSSPELLGQLVAEAAASGDPRRGEVLFRRKDLQCLKCHAVGGAGGRVGPDLSSIGASAQPDYLVDSLLDPNAKVKEAYNSVLVETDEGKVLTGLVVRETKTELVLRDAEDRQITIPVASIESKRDGRSLMPNGTVDALTRAELVDLVRFLSEMGKVGDFAIGRARVARRWQTLAWTKEAHTALNRTSYDTAASDNPALTWEAAYSRVGGDLPFADLPTFQIHGNTPPATFVRTQLEATAGGRVEVRINDTAGLSLWLDGKPTPVANPLKLDLEPGPHTVTVAIDHSQRKSPLRLELADAPAENPSSSGKAEWIGGK
ncbi:MAG: PVC-type heme-binding CxxCH protein [Planctomycetota bacterium]